MSLQNRCLRIFEFFIMNYFKSMNEYKVLNFINYLYLQTKKTFRTNNLLIFMEDKQRISRLHNTCEYTRKI